MQQPGYVNQAQAAPRNPFGGGGGQGNLFLKPAKPSGPGTLGINATTKMVTASLGVPGQNLACNRPISIKYQDLQHNALPQHPDTDAGRKAYLGVWAVASTADPSPIFI
jgi:hypothetical protein